MEKDIWTFPIAPNVFPFFGIIDKSTEKSLKTKILIALNQELWSIYLVPSGTIIYTSLATFSPRLKSGTNIWSCNLGTFELFLTYYFWL